MIAGIKGKVRYFENKERFILIEIYTVGGITYSVLTPTMSVVNVDDEIDLFTSYVVREESQTLYGFMKREEKDLFENLVTVSSIGPKTAISILSYYGYDETINLIANADEKALSKVSGLGGKGAKKIIIELQTKLEKVQLTTSSSQSSTKNGQNNFKIGSKVQLLAELEEALYSLGFVGREQKKALEIAKEIIQNSPDITIEMLVTEVLKK